MRGKDKTAGKTIMSINRSEIRKSALTLLYALRGNGDCPDSFDFDLFWKIAQEKKSDRMRESHARAVLHVCRASGESAQLLASRAEALLTAMQGDLTTVTLRDETERYANRSQAFEAAVSALSYCLGDNRREDTEQLALCTRDVLRLAAALSPMGEDLVQRFADFPASRSLTEPLAAAVRRRGKLMEATAGLSDPITLADSKEHAGLARQAADLQGLRPATEELVNAILRHREELEAELSERIANYSLERVDLIDSCILLIALYELRFNKLEPAIVISEANLLANAYSGSKSAPFIHGILASAAKA